MQKQDEFEYWIRLSTIEIEHIKNKIKKSKQEKQAYYTTMAIWYFYLGISQYLRGYPVSYSKHSFTKATEDVERSFLMAYDSSSFYFLDDKVNWSAVSMTAALDGFKGALMAGNLEAGRRLAKWVQIPPVEKPEEVNIVMTNYIYAIKYMLLSQKKQAIDYIEKNKRIIEASTEEKVKDNFYYRTKIIESILTNKPKLFDDYLEKLIKDFLKDAKNGNIARTPEAYVFTRGIAICNLASIYGLKFKTKNETLPEEFLIAT